MRYLTLKQKLYFSNAIPNEAWFKGYDPNICWNCHTTDVKNNYQIKIYFLSLILPLYERYLQQEMRKVNVAVEMKRDSCNKTTGNQSFRHGLCWVCQPRVGGRCSVANLLVRVVSVMIWILFKTRGFIKGKRKIGVKNKQDNAKKRYMGEAR